VKRLRKRDERTVHKVEVVNGMLLAESAAVRNRWAEYFEQSLNVNDDRDAVIVASGGERRMPVLWGLNEE
jgi:hypothetical protein